MKNSHRGQLHRRNAAKARSQADVRERILNANPEMAIPKRNQISREIEQLRSSGLPMQQKSAGVISWDDMESLYQTIGQAVVETAQLISNNCAAVTAAGRADAVFLGIIKNAMTDCDRITDQLIAVHESHKNMSGVLNGPEQLDFYYKVGASYNDIYEHFRAVTFQSATEITTYTLPSLGKDGHTKDLQTIVDEVLQNNNENLKSTEQEESQSS